MIIETIHELVLDHGQILAIAFAVMVVWLWCNIGRDL